MLSWLLVSIALTCFPVCNCLRHDDDEDINQPKLASFMQAKDKAKRGEFHQAAGLDIVYDL